MSVMLTQSSPQSVKIVVKQSKDKSINYQQVNVYQSRNNSHQTVQSEELNTTVVRREVEVLFLAQRKRVRL